MRVTIWHAVKLGLRRVKRSCVCCCCIACKDSGSRKSAGTSTLQLLLGVAILNMSRSKQLSAQRELTFIGRLLEHEQLQIRIRSSSESSTFTRTTKATSPRCVGWAPTNSGICSVGSNVSCRAVRC